MREKIELSSIMFGLRVTSQRRLWRQPFCRDLINSSVIVLHYFWMNS